VSVGDGRHGRRDNGLVAAEYAAAGDVDPRVGEHLLDVLALDGIAAYLRPSTDLHPVTRSTVLPSRPTDRLYVDRAHVEIARDYLTRLAEDAEPTYSEPTHAEPTYPEPTHAEPTHAEDGEAKDVDLSDADATANDESDREHSNPPRARHLVEPSSDEVDRAWAEIVAGYDSTAQPRPARSDASGPALPSETIWPDATGRDTGWPDAMWPDTARPEASRPDVRGDHVRPESRADQVRPDAPADQTGPGWSDRVAGEKHRPRAPEEEPSLLDGLDTFGADLPDEGDEEFTPPVAPPIPRPSLPTTLAVIGVIGGLAVFLKPDLLSFLNESLSMFLGFTAIVSGFGALVWRLRPGDDSDDDPDDGARV
jgi:hypothetical protein